MTTLYANNAKSTLSAPINTTATSLTLTSGTGALFPSPSGGNLFVMVLTDAATGNVYEVLHCTARLADVCTVVRAQEGTTALNWTTGDFANNVITAGTMDAILVNPMTAKGDLIAGGASGAPGRLAVGTNGQVLVADSSQADGLVWEDTFGNPMTTKGDLIAAGAAGAPARLPVGSNGQVLAADSTQAEGLNWVTPFASPMTTIGDLIVGGAAGAAERLGVGSDGQVLTADSGQPDGLNWETPFSNPMTAKGDLIVGGVSGADARLAVGSDGQVLAADSGQPDGLQWVDSTAGITPPPVNVQVGATYTLALADAPQSSGYRGIVTMDNAGANSLVVPPHSAEAWEPGTSFKIIQLGAGTTTVTAGLGVTLLDAGGVAGRAQNSVIEIEIIAADTWIVGGDTA